jgi:hypothetical protein
MNSTRKSVNANYTSLLQLVDYPTKLEHLAVGDRVVIERKWRRICALGDEAESHFHLTDEDDHVHMVWVYDLEAEKIPRIPGVLMDLISAASVGDPYR